MIAQESTYYLEMTDPGQLRPCMPTSGDVEIKQAKIASGELNRFFYTAVGRDWRWVDRLSWPLARWAEYAARPDITTWVLYVSGTPAGYFELESQPEEHVELAYFGLLPQFFGQRLGGYLLTEAIRQAWQSGAARVWVHTSSFDHPGALTNYESRGFRLFKVEVTNKELPDG